MASTTSLGPATGSGNSRSSSFRLPRNTMPCMTASFEIPTREELGPRGDTAITCDRTQSCACAPARHGRSAPPADIGVLSVYAVAVTRGGDGLTSHPAESRAPNARAYLALATAGFQRYATYRQATVAAVVTNSVFGFLRFAVMLAITHTEIGRAS